MESLLIIILSLEIALTIIFLSCLFKCYLDLKDLAISQSKMRCTLGALDARTEHIVNRIREIKMQGVEVKESK